MSDFRLTLLCPAITLGVYYANKWFYRRWRYLVLMPLIFTPLVLVATLVITDIGWADYIGDNYWLIWLLGPATLAFAVPVYENFALIRRHWLSLSAGVLTSILVAIGSSVWLAKLFAMPQVIQRSLAVRSITTPFALAAAGQVGGSRIWSRCL